MAPLNRTVLIVDDEDAYRELLTELLADAGFDVATAADGAEGLDMLEARRPYLVLLDVMMPVMDGKEFLERARDFHDESLRSVPIWVVSATTPSRTASTHLADGFLLKNVNLGSDVLALAARYLGAEHGS